MSLNYIKTINKRLGIMMMILTVLTGIMLAINIIVLENFYIVLLCAIISAFYLIFRKKDDKQHTLKYINMAFIMILVFYSMYVASYATAVPISIVGVALISLYFDEKLTIASGIIFSTFFFILGNLPNVQRDGMNDLGFTELHVMGTALIFIISLNMFFLCKMGLSTIQEAEKEKENSNTVLGNLEETLKVIKDSAITLSENVKITFDETTSLLESGNQMSDALDTMESGINEQSTSVSRVGELIKNTDDNMDSVSETTNKLSETVKNMEEIVSTSKGALLDMNEKMEDIDSTSAISLSLAGELEQGMKKVGEFLLGIHAIAEQTNLLALNASIEAARAGEAGKGFSVVADEVRKLAEESSRTADDVSKILEDISDKANQVLEKSQDNMNVTKEGTEIINEVTEKFENVENSFKVLTTHVEDEVRNIDSARNNFKDINNNFEKIVEVSESNTATTEEMIASIQSTISNINVINSSVEEIEKSVRNLTNITQS